MLNNTFLGYIVVAIGLVVIGLSWLGFISPSVATEIIALLGLGTAGVAHNIAATTLKANQVG